MRCFAYVRVASVVAVAACTTPNTAITASGPSGSDVISLDRDFELRPGQTARLDETAIAVSFMGVPEDSRCPADVQCVWAGNGAVSLVVTDGTGAKSTVILNTTLSPRSATVSGYEIGFTGLKPDPKQGSPIPLANYVATLRVTRP
ncbi:MAG TPA: hypothetical protein VES88_00140 [Gemmatimonadaceae bacterium]|nr:hypothetical protein [Gemmatimonadaceae bacterium]